MEADINHSEVNVKLDKSENEIVEVNTKSSFISMDMNVYEDDEETLYKTEIKKECSEVIYEENKLEENLPLNTIKNIVNHSQNEQHVEISNKVTKKPSKPEFKTNLGQKENFSTDNSEEKNSKRYRLRSRAVSKKVNGDVFRMYQNKKSTKLIKKTNLCAKCGIYFKSKSQFIIHMAEKINFRCPLCQHFFCSNNMLDSHMKVCIKIPKRNKNKYSCKKSEEVFPNQFHLENHIVVHEGKFFKCNNWNLVFSEKTEFEQHALKNECSSLNAYLCDICKKSFTHINVLRRHITAHLNSSEYLKNCFKTCKTLGNHNCDSKKNSVKTCHICKRTFLRVSKLKVHLLEHQKSTYKCEKCSQFLKSRELLNNHLNKSDCSFKDKLCEKNVGSCSGSVGQNGDLTECKTLYEGDCVKSSHNKKNLKYTCDFCRSKFSKLFMLKIHILNVHQGINFECKKCDLRFTCEEDLDTHVAKQDCKPEEPCTCKICGKVFAKRDYLKKHQYMHTNILFKCKYCYCAFMKEKNYKRHMEKMNCSKSARKIRMAEFNFKKCRICEIEFVSEELLIEHFKASHTGREPHQCFCCELCLPTFQDLQNHIHHHNVQKYTCNLCGKPYTSQEGFRKHRLKHKGAEFKCKFCDSQFLNENRFKLHEKTCKKNPENGYEPSKEAEKPKKKDGRPKQSRQLHWESQIIMKHLRGDPKCSTGDQQSSWQNKNESFIASTFFDEPEIETRNERGWFDNYYKTEEDDIAFGLKKGEMTTFDFESNFDVTEFLQKGSLVTKKKTNLTTMAVNGEADSSHIEDCTDDRMNNYSETSSNEFSTDSTDEDIKEVDLTIDYNPKKCRLCVITFGQEYELLHHFIKTHPGENAHKCPNCEVESPLFAQLKEHMKSHGIGIGVYNCDNCSKKFKNKKKMKNHNIRCKGMNINETMLDSNITHWGEYCRKCGKKFHTKFGYRRHKKLCKGKNIKNKKLSSNTRLSKAKDSTYFIESNDFYTFDSEEKAVVFEKSKTDSKDCKSVVDGATDFSITEANISLSEKPKEEKKKVELRDSFPAEPPMDSFPCRLCDKKFQYERGIVMHFKSAHPGNKPLICNFCNMHLADKLKEHLKTHGIGEEFICELCGKRFNQKFLSKIHEMWHQGIEYKCNNCKQKFLNKEKMEKHIEENRCSNRQSLMRLPCDICGKSYRSKFGLNKHYITHTPKELRPVKNRMNCEYCGKWFDNNNGLQRHRRIHTGERPFCCRFCPKAFAQEGNCKAHERIHTGESKPRKKKSQSSMPLNAEPPVPAVPLVPASISMPSTMDTASYPAQINLYVYNTIDSSGIVR